MTEIVLAILIGGAFGVALDRVGATNPDYIIGMLRLSRLHLMKTILFAIGVASIFLFGALLTGIADPGNLSVKGAHAGVLLGGILLGVGFAVAGYCPGTGLAAGATGRKDAIVFVVGGLVGAAAFMASYGWVKSTGILSKLLGGKATLGLISETQYPALLGSISGELIGIAVGFMFVGIAYLLPDSLRGPSRIKGSESKDAAS